jgi:excisionase family DNA binding protein
MPVFDLPGKRCGIITPEEATTMQSPTEVDKVLSVEQAAEVLGIAPRTMRRWIKERSIPSVKIGGRLRIMRSSLLGWIWRQERAVGSPPRG